MFSPVSFTLPFYTLHFFFSFCLCFFSMCLCIDIPRSQRSIFKKMFSALNICRAIHKRRRTQQMNIVNLISKTGFIFTEKFSWFFFYRVYLVSSVNLSSPFFSLFFHIRKIRSHLFPSFSCLFHFSPIYCYVFHIYVSSCKVLVTFSLYFFLWFLLYVAFPFSGTRELIPGSV